MAEWSSKQRPHSQWRDRAGFTPDFPVMPLAGTQTRIALYHDHLANEKSLYSPQSTSIEVEPIDGFVQPVTQPPCQVKDRRSCARAGNVDTSGQRSARVDHLERTRSPRMGCTSTARSTIRLPCVAAGRSYAAYLCRARRVEIAPCSPKPATRSAVEALYSARTFKGDRGPSTDSSDRWRVDRGRP